MRLSLMSSYEYADQMLSCGGFRDDGVILFNKSSAAIRLFFTLANFTWSSRCRNDLTTQ